jgi:hypothetical protein
MEEKLWLYEDRKCESRFMEAFKTHPGNLFSLTHNILSDSSLDSDFIWLLFNHKFNAKFRIEDEKGNLTDKPNIEVDIVGGKCGSNLIDNKLLSIKPLLDFIVAIEVKCSRYDYNEENEEKKLKAKQRDDEQEEIQKQLYDRLKMGFNKVASLDILFTNPGKGQDIWAWLNASDNIFNVHNIMKKDGIFKDRLDNESLEAVGRYFFGKGSVRNDDINEFLSGSGEAVVKKESKLNPFLEDKNVIENHRKMEKIFRNIGIAEQFNFHFDFKKYSAWLFPHVLPINLNKGFNLYLFHTNSNK